MRLELSRRARLPAQLQKGRTHPHPLWGSSNRTTDPVDFVGFFGEVRSLPASLPAPR